MEFEFKKDIYGRPFAKFSMGHEVIGRYFSDELNCSNQINKLIKIIDEIESGKRFYKELRSFEYQLSFNPAGLEIFDLSLEADFDEELPVDCDFYDQESQAECGLEDFKLALTSWLGFID